MWADPARETDLNPENENMFFLENERRKTSCLFTENALKAFLKNTGYQYVIRAHECHVSRFYIWFLIMLGHFLEIILTSRMISSETYRADFLQ